ncbi:MAG: sensor histidine kinase [Candidatus Micrarchaeia archaeon]
MLDNAAIIKFLFDTIELGRILPDQKELTEKFIENAKGVFGFDDIKIKEVGQKREGIEPSDEYVINTGKIYLDNRLSSYSAFPELINYYNSGFKSIAIFPIASDSKVVGTVEIFSKTEEKFNQDLLNALSLGIYLFGYQWLSRMERERSFNLAKYFDASFESIIPQALIETNGKIVKANKSMLNIFSKSQIEFVGKNIKEFFDIDANMIAILSKGFIAEVHSLNSRTFAATSRMIGNRLMHTTFLETTEKIDLSEKISALSESNLEFLFKANKDTEITWFSDNAEMVLPQAGILVGRKLLDIVVEKDKLNEDIQNEISKGSYTLNIGNSVAAEVKIILRKTREGYVGLMLDNKLERYAKNLSNNFNQLLQSTSDIILIVDELGYLKELNRSAEQFLGYKSEEIKGKEVSLIYDEEGKVSLRKALDIVSKEGSASNVFCNIIAKDGTLVPSYQNISGLIDQSGKLSGYIIFGKELLTKKRMENLDDMLAESKRNEERFKGESDLKTQFIYNISHELKTPITNIKGFSSLLQKGEFGNLNDEQKSYVKIILDESERLMQLIQQILDVAKLSSGKIKLDLQEVNLAKLKENPSIKALEEVATNKGLIFSWNVDYNIPYIIADPNRLIQVFVNLINNAIKFTEHGSINIKIYRKGKNVRIEVSDTGVGISKEDQRKLFKKFYQVPRKGLTKPEGSGTGLGLSITKEIIALHKGRIGVNSELGKGSTFWFTIPIDLRKKKENS